MSCSAQQGEVGGAVVHGKIHVDAWDPDASHDLGRALQQLVVLIARDISGALGDIGVRCDDCPGPESVVIGTGRYQGLTESSLVLPEGLCPFAQRFVVGIDQL